MKIESLLTSKEFINEVNASIPLKTGESLEQGVPYLFYYRVRGENKIYSWIATTTEAVEGCEIVNPFEGCSIGIEKILTISTTDMNYTIEFEDIEGSCDAQDYVCHLSENLAKMYSEISEKCKGSEMCKIDTSFIKPRIDKKKIVFIDLDWTLIKPLVEDHSRPEGLWDMKFDIEVLKQLSTLKPTAIFIVSNQGGIEKGRVKKEFFRKKISVCYSNNSRNCWYALFCGRKILPYK